MRLFTGLQIGKESMSTHAAAINSIADNLANQNTPGFKSSRAEFATLLADSIGSLLGSPLNPGNGVQATDINQNFTQGGLDSTGRELDMAIDGNGFFVVRRTSGGVSTDFFTRAGNFQTDANGNILTVSGEQVLGFTTASPATLVPLNIRNVASVSDPTTTVSVFGNLNSAAPQAAAPAAAPASFTELNAASEFSASIRLIDSLGDTHDVALHYFHTGNLTWSVQAYVDSGETTATAGTPVLLGSTTITADATGAQATAAAPLQFTTGWLNGAAATPVSINVGTMTGFASASNVQALQANGTIPGSIQGVSVDENGVLLGNLSNGERVVIGTIGLAEFRNINGLEKIGNNLFASSDTTGVQTNGSPGSTTFGRIRAQSLELANVDPANEFVNLVQFQRGYQAGSQIVSTLNEIIKATINLA